MATESNYYVPEQSKLPILMALGLGVTGYGAGSWVLGGSPVVFLIGSLILAAVFYSWFSTVIRENQAGMANAQLKRSYVWGMSWFIFSEVMFFAVFFGALFYVRMLAVPWLGGEGHGTENPNLLWPGFQAEWPLYITPDQAASGDAAKVKGPDATMGPWGLPLINTIILLTSSVTVHFAHTALKAEKRKHFTSWLGLTVLLAVIFLFVQAYEYIHAYQGPWPPVSMAPPSSCLPGSTAPTWCWVP